MDRSRTRRSSSAMPTLGEDEEDEGDEGAPVEAPPQFRGGSSECCRSVSGTPGMTNKAVESLSSDAQLEEAETLLLEAQAQSRALSVFTSTDILNLAENLSILEYEAGEVVMQQGEHASWVGIVLSGVIVACSSEGVVYAHMKMGTIVGEFSFFAGGRRATDVKGAERGFIAMVNMSNLVDMFRNAPHTAHKLVHVFGHSSVHKMAFNPQNHKPIAWSMAPTEAAATVATWRKHHFNAQGHDISAAELDHLISYFNYHTFKPEEKIMDRFAKNETVCFVLSGQVALVVRDRDDLREVKLGTRGPGTLVADVSFYDAEAMPCDAIGEEEGIIAGIAHDTIRDLAIEKPMLALAVMRMIGASAVASISRGLDSCTFRRPEVYMEPVARRGGGAQAQQEIFYRSKMAKQMLVTQVAAQEVKQAEKEKVAAKHRARGLKILERKLEADTLKAQEELRAGKDQLRATQNQVKNLKLELQKAQESDGEYRQLAITREQEVRARRETEKDLLEALRVARAANHGAEMSRLRDELTSQQQAVEREVAASAELKQQAQSLNMLLEVRVAMDAQARADCKALLRESTATIHALLRELPIAEAHASAEAKGRRRAEADVRAAERAARLECALVSEELRTAEDDCVRLEKVTRQQRLATKVLAMWDFMQMTTMRRQVHKLSQQEAKYQSIIVDLPFRNKMLLKQKQGLEADLNEARRTLQPLQEDMAAKEARCTELQREIGEMHRRDGMLRAAFEKLEQRNCLLMSELASTQLANVRGVGRLASSQQAARDATQRLERQRIERAGLENGILTMTQRLVDYESSFGKLLVPKSPQPDARASTLARSASASLAGSPRSGSPLAAVARRPASPDASSARRWGSSQGTTARLQGTSRPQSTFPQLALAHAGPSDAAQWASAVNAQAIR